MTCLLDWFRSRRSLLAELADLRRDLAVMHRVLAQSLAERAEALAVASCDQSMHVRLAKSAEMAEAALRQARLAAAAWAERCESALRMEEHSTAELRVCQQRLRDHHLPVPALEANR